MLDAEPIVLQGEGHYALTAIKEIKVTEEFLGLGQEVTSCQTKEFWADCVSRRYQEQVLASCHCAPLYIRSHFPQEVLLKQKYSKYSATLQCIARPRSAPATSWTV